MAGSGSSPLDSVPRRTRSRWDEFFRSQLELKEKKEKNQECGGSDPDHTVNDSVEGGERLDSGSIGKKSRKTTGEKTKKLGSGASGSNVEHISGRLRSRKAAGEVESEKDNGVDLQKLEARKGKKVVDVCNKGGGGKNSDNVSGRLRSSKAAAEVENERVDLGKKRKLEMRERKKADDVVESSERLDSGILGVERGGGKNTEHISRRLRSAGGVENEEHKVHSEKTGKNTQHTSRQLRSKSAAGGGEIEVHKVDSEKTRKNTEHISWRLRSRSAAREGENKVDSEKTGKRRNVDDDLGSQERVKSGISGSKRGRVYSGRLRSGNAAREVVKEMPKVDSEEKRKSERKDVDDDVLEVHSKVDVEEKRELEMNETVDADDVMDCLDEHVVSNNSDLKKEPDTSVSWSKMDSLDEVVSTILKNIGSGSTNEEGDSGLCSTEVPQIKPLDGEQSLSDVAVELENSMIRPPVEEQMLCDDTVELESSEMKTPDRKQMLCDDPVELENSAVKTPDGKQMHCDVPVKVESSTSSGETSDSSDGSDDSDDSDSDSDSESSSEYDEFSDEDYKVDQSSVDGSSSDDSSSSDSDVAYDRAKMGTQMEWQKERVVVISDDDESNDAYNAGKHASGRSDRRKTVDEEVITIDETEFLRNETSRSRCKKVVFDDAKVDEGYQETQHKYENENEKGSGELDGILKKRSVFGLESTQESYEKERQSGELGDSLKKTSVFGLDSTMRCDKSNIKEEVDLSKFLGPSTEKRSTRDQHKYCHIDWEVDWKCSNERVNFEEKKSPTAKELELIKILLDSLNANKFQQFTVNKDVLIPILPTKFTFEDEVLPPLKKSEWQIYTDSLFRELDLGLLQSEVDCTYSSEKENNHINPTEKNQTPAARCGRGEHLSVLDEQIGIICKYCGTVILEIKYVLPPFYKRPFNRRDWREPDESRTSFAGDIYFPDSSYRTTWSTTSIKGTVWKLIPGIEKGMFPHQREGFEFIWKNIAGGIILDEMEHNLLGGNGCIISHAPGTGKTRLTIAFLQTFLKLYPDCCPMIIAPKGMLLNWEAEFAKWKFNVPFHNMNMVVLSVNENTAATHILGQLGGGFSNRDVIRLLKLYSWIMDGGILAVSYQLFVKLTREDKKDELREKIRDVLLNRPGLLVLDEGHTPRNDRSMIWNVLSKVSTHRRIILSGTPFQNNLLELFNTLILVNPKFVNQIGLGDFTFCSTDEKDQLARKRWTAMTRSIGETKDRGLSKLRAMLDPFVHVHKGTVLDECIPALRHTFVFLHPTPCQKTLLNISSSVSNVFHRVHFVSLVSVHPSLLPNTDRQFVESSKLKEVDEANVDAGVKMKFLLKLIVLADALGERVLVFSQFLDPLLFIRKQIESCLSWSEGRELLYMDGTLDERQRQDSISSFNDETSEAKVLLASQRSCSEGINLIGASRVVLLDTVWNPSVEKQAISRAYRLGQKKVVHVYRLFTSGIEVKQFAQQIKKVHLSQLIFSPGNEPTCQGEKPTVTSNDDKVLEAMLGLEGFNAIFEDIIYQPTESQLTQMFRLDK